MTEARRHVVELLADLDVRHNANIADVAQWLHRDGRRLTADEVDVVAYASHEEWQAAKRFDLLRRHVHRRLQPPGSSRDRRLG